MVLDSFSHEDKTDVVILDVYQNSKAYSKTLQTIISFVVSSHSFQ